MKLKLGIYAVLSIFLLATCTKEWDDHYNVYPETVDQNVWEALQNDPEITDFINLLEDFRYDTLFKSDIPYTLFVPSNEALAGYMSLNEVDTTLLNYHIVTHFIQSASIEGIRKVQTLSKKYALFERTGIQTKLDGIALKNESPLYNNGKYFVLEEVAKPLPNLYQFYKENNPVLRDYIDSQDSIILDRERSEPIGFDEDGNTVYDSVNIVYNLFEAEYFPVSQESRNLTATFVFPQQEDYEEALTVMAQDLNIPGYVDYNNIPLDWQNDILIPHLLEQGVFLNMIEPEEFVWKSEKDTLKLLNILGDSIQILYTPVDKSICSNGYAYNYDSFEIPDSLYNSSSKFEAELLLDETGLNRYAWYENVNVVTDQAFSPRQEYISSASNDTIVRVLFPRGYSGRYSVEFKTHSVFPRKYAMEIATHMEVGGVYDIYVNDELVRTFDYYDFVRYRGVMPSVIPGKRYIPKGSFNSFDVLVDNIEEYSRPKVKIEYKGPGSGISSNGLVIDYIDFIPFE
ncbi:MAG: fasciclin domain-containing protein [Bacteroidota bacterium]